MENFTFYNPTKILFGKDREREIGEVLKQDNIKRVLFVYGKESIKRIGLYERVIEALRKANVEYIEHPGVKPNPTLSHTTEGIRRALEGKVQAVLAVGGGSVVDEAKAIALGVVVGESNLWSYFRQEREIESALPVYDILTLAATGSEMNGNAVITHDETREKLYISSPVLCPRVSILNPELTLSVPREYQAYAAVDVIAHLIELYFSAEYCPKIQARLIEGLIKTVMETTEAILQNPGDYQARAEFMWASTLALNGLMQIGFRGGDFPNHLLAHAIGGLFDLPHGACLSIVIPAWMRWYVDRNYTQFGRFATEVFGKKDPFEGILGLKSWFRQIGSPVSLKEANLNEIALHEIALMVEKIAPIWGLEEIYDYNTAKEILSFALE